ncbi:MAG: hypothetical protein LBU27_07600 [Candidatus Peribacteria bacterium]|jgi:valyl-tRNA synthetase|nr:hypothetical protein [Candidatus Peribacteria bacterium]
MCCTYGDETDVYRVQKHNLPEKVIINRYGIIQNSGCEVIEGLKVDEAREKIMEYFEQLDKNLNNTNEHPSTNSEHPNTNNECRDDG